MIKSMKIAYPVVISKENDGLYYVEIPQPHMKEIAASSEDIVTLIDVNFIEYRKKVDNKAVKKNCTIPYWLSVESEKAGINYSKVLQEAIIKVLGINKGVC